MWKKIILIMLFFALIPCACSKQHQLLDAIPETPAGIRFSEIISAINSGDYITVKNYVTNNFSDEFLGEVTIDRMVNSLMTTHTNSNYLEFIGVSSSSKYRIIGILKNSLMDSYIKYGITVEAQELFKIDSVFSGPSEPPDQESDTTEMDEIELVVEMESFLNRLANADVFSGTVLIAKNDRILFQKRFGYASKDLMTPNRIDTRFNIGSVGKMFTAIAIAQLVEKGLISFEDPVGKYLSSEWVNDEIAEKVRIEHLLTHTSGLGDYLENQQFKEIKEPPTSLDYYKPFVSGEHLNFEPGSEWAYSNTGFLLLGVIIENVTGQSYYTYMSNSIFEPSDMSGPLDVSLQENEFPAPDFAIGYSKEYTEQGLVWKDNLDLMNITVSSPAGGGFSNVEDLFKFSVALNDNVLISEETKMVLLSGKPALNSPFYGFGFEVSKKHNELMVGHGGSHDGIGAMIIMFLDSEYTLIVLSNYGHIIFSVKDKFIDLVL